MQSEVPNFWSYDGGNFSPEDSSLLQEWREKEVETLSKSIYRQILHSKQNPFPYLHRYLKTKELRLRAARDLAQFAFGIKFASRLITDGEIDGEQILNQVATLTREQVASLLHVDPDRLLYAYIPQNCPVDEITDRIIINLNYFAYVATQNTIDTSGGSYTEINHEDVAFFAGIEEFAHLAFDHEREGRTLWFSEDFQIENAPYAFSRDQELEALVWKALAEELFDTHFGFAQRLGEATDYQFEARLMLIQSSKDCGQVCLNLLGYDGYAMFPDQGISSDDILSIEGAFEITIEDLENQDFDYPHLLLIFGKGDIAGAVHWILRQNEWVYCPTYGKVDAESYMRDRVGSVIQQFIVPISGGRPVPDNYYDLEVIGPSENDVNGILLQLALASNEESSN